MERMLDPEQDLQELPSSEEDDDDMDAAELRGRLQRLTRKGTGVESPDFTSPIGSPPDDDSVLSGAKERFLELKKLVQEDKKARRAKKKAERRARKKAEREKSRAEGEGDSSSPDVERLGFEEIPSPEDEEEWEREGSVSPASYHDDVDQLLESFRSERAAGERDFSIVSHRLESHPKMLEICQQLRERDQAILSLESKVLELDRQVIDLQDTLSEKDKLLNSKNDAVNCMVTQYQQSIADRDEELSKTQESLMQLQRKFGAAQDNWKVEKDSLNEKIKALEDSNKASSKDQELEEKLSVLKEDRDRLTQDNVRIQSLLDEVTKEKGELEQTLNEKDEETKTEVESKVKAVKEEYETRFGKMKKQFAAKIKAAKEEAGSETQLVKDLQTRLKEIQEQLDVKVQEVDLQTANVDLLSKELEEAKENLKHNEELKTTRLENAALEEEIEHLKSQLSEALLSPPKADADETEFLLKISSLEDTILELQRENMTLCSTEEELTALKAEKESSEKDFNSRLAEYERNFGIAMEDHEKRIEEYEQKISELSTITAEKPMQITSSDEVDSSRSDLQNVIEEKDRIITDLNASLEKTKEQMIKMKKQFQAKLKAVREEHRGGDGGQVSPDSQLQTKCSSLEQRVAELEEEKSNNLWIQEELNQLKLEKESLESEKESVVQNYERQIHELQTAVERAAQQINELEQQQVQQSASITAAAAQPESEGDGWGWETENRTSELEQELARAKEQKVQADEEIARLKLESDVLEQKMWDNSKEYETKMEELEAEVTKKSEQMTKLKRQFQVKLKQLKEEKAKAEGAVVKEVTDSTSSSPCPPSDVETQLQEKIVALENKIALLEEEKGNLLLQMVDFDQQQVQRTVVQQSAASPAEDTVRLEMCLAEKEEEVRHFQQRVQELGEALIQKNDEVERHMLSCTEMQQYYQRSVEDLSKSVVTKDEEISSQIATLEAQVSSGSINLMEKDQEIQILQDQLVDAEQRFQEMKSTVEEYQGIVEGIRSKDKEELLQLQEEFASIREKATITEEVFEKMKASYAEETSQRVNRITELETDLEALRQDLILKGSECESLTAAFSQREAEITRLESEVARNEAKVNELHQQIIKSVEVEHKMEEHVVAELEAKIQNLEAEIQQKSSNFDSLTEQYRSKETDFVSQIEILTSQLASYEIEIEQLRKSSGDVEQDLQTVDLQNSSIAAELEEKEKQFKALEQQLLDDLASRNEQIQSLNWQIENAKLDYESSVTGLKEEQETVKKQLSDYVAYSESLKTELENLRTYSSNMEANYNQVYTDLCQKSAQLEQILGADNQNQSIASNLRTELDQATANIAELQKQLGQSEQEKTSLQAQVEQYHSESEALRSKLTGLTNEYIQLRETLESKDQGAHRLRQDFETLQAEYSHSNNELKMKISSLMDQLNECEAEMSVSAARLKESDDICNDLRQRLDEVQKTVEENVKLLEEKTRGLEQAENAVFEKTEEAVRLEEKLKELDEQYRGRIEQDFSKYSGDLNASYDQLMITASDNVQLQNQVKQKDEELEDLRAQLQVASSSMGFSMLSVSTSSQGLPDPVAPTQPIPVVEPEIVPQVAYVTTDQPSTSASSSSQELEAALKEIKELKVKNGKTIQRFKQLKDKYDTLLKEHEAFKSKKEFSLDSAFEDEFMSQVKSKDSAIEEKGKLIKELQAENQRLLEKIDVLEGGTERLTELKEDQDRQILALTGNKRALETEVSALKWKMEELENLVSIPQPSSEGSQGESGGNQGYFDVPTMNPDVQQLNSLQQQNAILSQEIHQLRGEIEVHKKAVDELNEKNQQLEEEVEKLQEMGSETQQVSTVQGSINNQQHSVNSHLTSLQQQLEAEQQEKNVLEKRIELLQNKISEIEVSEMKCFEESMMLKSWTRQLELDNLKTQRELEKIYASIQAGDTNEMKSKVLQDEVLRLVDALQDRDKRCEQLTLEITRLIEDRDILEKRFSTAPQISNIPSFGDDGVRQRLAELEQLNYSIGIDLRREKEARRLVQEQLFFSSSSRRATGGGESWRQSVSYSYTPPKRHPVTPATQPSATPPSPQQQFQTPAASSSVPDPILSPEVQQSGIPPTLSYPPPSEMQHQIVPPQQQAVVAPQPPQPQIESSRDSGHYGAGSSNHPTSSPKIENGKIQKRPATTSRSGTSMSQQLLFDLAVELLRF